MSSEPLESEAERGPRERAAGVAESLPIPTSRVFWLLVAVGVVLIYLGMSVATGELTGILGLWGISLVVFTVLTYGGYELWLRLG